MTLAGTTASVGSNAKSASVKPFYSSKGKPQPMTIAPMHPNSAHAIKSGRAPAKVPPTPVEGASGYRAYVYAKRIGTRTADRPTLEEARAAAQVFANQYGVTAVIYALVNGEQKHAGVVQPARR